MTNRNPTETAAAPAATPPPADTLAATGPTADVGVVDAPSPSLNRSVILGQHVMVKLAPASMLINGESGGFFVADTPTPQTVTVTLLRRLQDGDLLLC